MPAKKSAPPEPTPAPAAAPARKPTAKAATRTAPAKATRTAPAKATKTAPAKATKTAPATAAEAVPAPAEAAPEPAVVADDSTEAAPLNRAERRARGKGKAAPQPTARGKVVGSHGPTSSHRMWANRRSG